MPSNYLILCHRLLLLPSIFPSIRVFSNDSPMSHQLFTSGGQSTGVSASTSVLEHSGLVSFRMDWFDLLAVQGTLKSLLQHHSLKASILWCAAYFIVQVSHPYMTTGKTMALIRWTLGTITCCLLQSRRWAGVGQTLVQGDRAGRWQSQHSLPV